MDPRLMNPFFIFFPLMPTPWDVWCHMMRATLETHLPPRPAPDTPIEEDPMAIKRAAA